MSNLDAKLRVQMRTEISKLHNKLDATMIYVTHDQTEAMTMGDRIVVMKDGFVQQVDKPLNLYNKPENKFVAGFIGSPAMNFIDGSVSNNVEEFRSSSGTINISLNNVQKNLLKEYAGKQVSAGIRPEDIHDTNEFNSIPTSGEINVELDVVEPMGNEIFLYFTIDNYQFISRILAREIPEAAAKKKLFINTSKVHFF